MSDEFRYPKTGDRILTHLGDGGVMLGMAAKPHPHKPWVWNGQALPKGPIVVLLEHGTVTGFAFDEVRLA